MTKGRKCIKVKLVIITVIKNEIDKWEKKGEWQMYAALDDTLLTGNKMIDSQHEELIYRINELIKSCENELVDRVRAVRTLDFLSDYTEYHFAEEEKLQREIGYPGLERHKKEHEALRDVVRDLYDMLSEQEGPTEAFVNMVQKNVVEWLYTHIKGFDRSVAEYKFMRDNPGLI